MAGLWSRGTEPLRPLHGHLPFQGRHLVRRLRCLKNFTRKARSYPPLSPSPKHRPSLKTERFQRGRSCGTGGNPVRGAPARLHRRKLLVKGGSGGRRAAWNPRRPPAAFGSFPLRERNSCVRRRTKLSQATPRTPSVCPPSTVAASNYKSIKSTAEERKLGSYAQVFPSSH